MSWSDRWTPDEIAWLDACNAAGRAYNASEAARDAGHRPAARVAVDRPTAAHMGAYERGLRRRAERDAREGTTGAFGGTLAGFGAAHLTRRTSDRHHSKPAKTGHR